MADLTPARWHVPEGTPGLPAASPSAKSVPLAASIRNAPIAANKAPRDKGHPLSRKVVGHFATSGR